MSKVISEEDILSAIEARWKTIRQKMEAHKHLLAKHGIMAVKVYHGKRIWRVRFSERQQDGKIIRRAIYVGTDPQLVERARFLLRALQEDTVLARKTAALVKLAIGVKAALLRQALNMGRRRRKAIK